MTVKDNDPERLVGDYLLKERISSSGHVTTWLADQVSVGRSAIVDELLDLSAGSRDAFLADTRARAAVDHPFIASVYEAVDSEGHCFRASERLTGETLQSMLDANVTLEPARMARMIRCIAEANLHHETNARSTLPLTLRYVHVSRGDVIRVVNLAVAGHRNDGESPRDVVCLGRELVPLVAHGCAGTTRMLTLLAWMRGKERPSPLQWHEIIDLCDQIDRQLSAPINTIASDASEDLSNSGKRVFLLLGGFTLAAMVVILIFAWVIRSEKPEPIDPAHLAPILIPAGDYPDHEGGIVSHGAFLIDARETTIGEYREFLETLEVLAADGHQGAFDHPEQPEEKTSHEPDDWPALLAAARARGLWNGMLVSLNSPVPGVDWWDAVAYANWRKARLPTQEEWAAAVNFECEDPASIPVGLWHPLLPANCPDRSPAGLLGVAGSLCEWTRSKSISPANPLGRPQHIIVGGSYLQTNGNALSREWSADPGLRRADLGFRLVRDIPAGE
jgi:hypothetical protein